MRKTGKKELENKSKTVGNKKRQINSTGLIVACIVAGLLSVLIIVLSFLFYRNKIVESANIVDNLDKRNYKKHYAMITSDSQNVFWQNVYKEAKDSAEAEGAYLEFLGTNLDVDYTVSELMKIAIESKMDGIIVEANEEGKMSDLIGEATKKGIPVVTILGDCHGSQRISFVGISTYNLGQEYGKLVWELLQEQEEEKEQYKVLVLMDEDRYDTSQNRVYTGIQESIQELYEGNADIEIKTFQMNQRTAFGAEEVLRDIFLSEEGSPDIVICLDEMYTTCAYQAAIDYNMVGQVDILGYYQSDTILQGIDSHVISASLTVDTTQMGKACIDALTEYEETGYVSDYMAVKISLIEAENVSEYMGR